MNITENSFLEPKEYYLIILGILVGTLIFIFVIFSLFYFNSNRRFNALRRRLNEYRNPVYPRFDTYNDTNPETNTYDRNPEINTYDRNPETNTYDRNPETNTYDRNPEINTYDTNQDITDNNEFNCNTRKNPLYDSNYQDEYLEINTQNSLKRRHSASDMEKYSKTNSFIMFQEESINEDKKCEEENLDDNIKINRNKNDLMSELRNSFPKLVPRNMLND